MLVTDDGFDVAMAPRPVSADRPLDALTSSPQVVGQFGERPRSQPEHH
jgi:hypothetical protein